MAQKNIELIVGVFTFIGLVILSFLIFFVSDVVFFKKGYEINAVFNYVSILDKGAPVRMSGVRVGEVKNLAISYEEKTQKPVVTLTLFVNSTVVVREKTQIMIRGTTPLSEPHVEILSLGLEEGSPLENGATIRGVDPIPMDQVIMTANDIAEKLKLIVTRVSDFFEDKEVPEAVKGILLNTNELTKSLNEIIEGKQTNIMDAIANIEKSTKSLGDVLEKVQDGKGTAGKVFVDEELYNEILAFVKDLRAHPWKLLAKPKEGRGKLLGIL